MVEQKKQGQALLVYVIVIALVAMVSIPAFKALGDAVHVAAVDSAEKITNRK